MTNVTFAVHGVRYKNQRPDDSAKPDTGLAVSSQGLVNSLVQAARPAEHAVRGKGCPENLPADCIARPLIPECPNSQHATREKLETSPRPLVAESLLLLIREDCNRHR